MTLVIDASVLVKLFRDETDSSQAHEFCQWVADERHPVIEPYILKHELCLATLTSQMAFTVPLALLAGYRRFGWQLIDPPRSTWLLAEEICRSGSKKAGFPSLQDSLYHALAIDTGGTLVTADTRHLAKTKSFGHAVALADWEQLTTS